MHTPPKNKRAPVDKRCICYSRFHIHQLLLVINFWHNPLVCISQKIAQTLLLICLSVCLSLPTPLLNRERDLICRNKLKILKECVNHCVKVGSCVEMLISSECIDCFLSVCITQDLSHSICNCSKQKY